MENPTKSDISDIQVAVLFEEQEITNLFSFLINSHGFKTRAITACDQILENERLVTEPQYINIIPENKKQNALLIGNKDALLNAPGIKLTRPLTEPKILSALEKFLS